MNLREARTEYDRRTGEKRRIQEEYNENKIIYRGLVRVNRLTEKARAIHQQVSKETQEELQFRISDLVSSALEAVFDEPYEFKVEFVVRRGKTECDLSFLRDGEAIHPITASGGGAVDIASFALRLALWTLQTPRTRNVLILDEPFKFLSEDLMPKASEMLKRLSEKLELQVIMVTHSEDLTSSADKTFHITQRKGVSKVG